MKVRTRLLALLVAFTSLCVAGVFTAHYAASTYIKSLQSEGTRVRRTVLLNIVDLHARLLRAVAGP